MVIESRFESCVVCYLLRCFLNPVNLYGVRSSRARIGSIVDENQMNTHFVSLRDPDYRRLLEDEGMSTHSDVSSVFPPQKQQARLGAH